MATLLEGESPVKIVACFPRAVKWLMHQAGVAFPEDRVDVLNMREESAATILDELIETE